MSTRGRRNPSRNSKTKVSSGTSARPTEPDLQELASVTDARDRASDLVDAACEQAAALQTEAESAAARTVADTHDRVTAMLNAARTRAEAITSGAVQDADSQRQAVRGELNAAREEADRLLADAHARAGDLLRQAQAQVGELTELAAADQEATHAVVTELRSLAEADLAEVSRLIRQRRDEAGSILARAQQQAEQLLAAAQREVDQAGVRCAVLAKTAAGQYDDRRAEAEQLYAEASSAADARRREAAEVIASARTEAAEAQEALQTRLRQLTQQFDAEAAKRRQALAAELADLKEACEKQRERLAEESKSVARKLRDAATKDAERITADATKKATAITARAQADEARARRLLDEAREAKRENSRWRGLHQRLSRKAWKTAPWIALAAGVGLAASGEYELATMVGINGYVAPLLPVSIDVYCVTAFRAKKDIPYALLLMASANVTYHLSEQAHIVKEGQSAPWQLTTFVVLIFVAVIWRVHTLMHDDSTDGHGSTAGTGDRTGTAPGTGTPARTGTHPRPDGTDGAPARRTEATGHDVYAAHDSVRRDGTATGRDRTDPVRPGSHPPHSDTDKAAVARPYSDRTDGVHTTPDGAARTGTPTAARTGTASAAVQTRPGTVRARTQSDGGVVPGARTGTTVVHAPATGTGSTDRPGTPARTDEELLPLVQELPRDADGYVTLYQARTKLSVNQPRAVRLLSRAGLLRPEDADKHLT